MKTNKCSQKTHLKIISKEDKKNFMEAAINDTAIDIAKLKATYRYDIDTGNFINRHRNKIVKVNVSKKNRYPRLNVYRLNGKRTKVRVHKLVMLYMGIDIPKDHVIDHSNGNPLDNRLSNLRFVTFSENMVNRIITEKTNISEINGVFHVKIKRNYKFVLNEKFNTIDQAIEAREIFSLQKTYLQ